MKLIDLVILFVLITLPFQMISDIRANNLEAVTYKKMVMNRLIDTAVEDGVACLVDRGEGSSVLINKEKCVDAFLNTLYINFGILDDPHAKGKIAGYIPVIVIVDRDGFYFYANETYHDDDGYSLISQVWHPKTTFAYTKNQYVYGFTLDDEVSVYDLATGIFYEGRQGELKGQVPAELLQDDVLFDQVRRRTIIETLQREVNDYINHHNETARQYGITYQFALPVIEDETWEQTIDDVGMLAFFQGMPMGIGSSYYNQYGIGGAQLIKGERFYLQADVSNGLTYYHREDCALLTDKSKSYNHQSQCALEGAFPCDICQP